MKIGDGWLHKLGPQFDKPYMTNLKKFLSQEYSENTIYPPRENIFRALELTDYNKVKVCILGQDPYHGPLQANGLAFAVNEGQRPPPSLLNIFKEVKNDCGETPNSTTLVGWAEQGVLLLNTVLTVRNGLPNSHKDSGWVIFTDQIIQALNEREERVIFMLWGNPARGKRGWIKDSKHIVLESAHPSPLAAHKGFFGCKHFSKANNFLEEKINWTNSRSLKNA